jgi:uncharacterized protein YifN (PemK superfamily)
LQVGKVLRCFIDFTTPPKEKRFIILGINEAQELLGVVFINSHINFNVMNTPTLTSLQYELKSSDNLFLTHDSFVNCAEIQKISQEKVKEFIQNDMQNILGEVKQQDLINIITLVQNAPTITPKTLKMFGLK